MHPTEDVCKEEVKGDRTVRRSVWPVEFWRWWSPQRASSSSERASPSSEHLIIFVSGINGSANDWRFAAEQFKKKFGDKVIVYCSSKNSSKRTFDGIEKMGIRLADEVRESVRESKQRGVKKISFVAHSLGGLIARYAIAVLMYSKPVESLVCQESVIIQEFSSDEAQARRKQFDHCPLTDTETGGNGSQQISAPCNTIEDLEPVNFITVATPHLGSRGNRYLPFLFGIPLLEKVAPYVAHWFVGETGRHLFLADRHKAQEPLLLRMVEDGDELKFISSLQSFKQRTLYANVCHDHMVGWHTASIEGGRQAKPKACNPSQQSENKYPHILKDVKLSVEADNGPKSRCEEDRMVSGLRQVQWRRVDVSFMNAYFKYLTHNTIQSFIECEAMAVKCLVEKLN